MRKDDILLKAETARSALKAYSKNHFRDNFEKFEESVQKINELILSSVIVLTKNNGKDSIKIKPLWVEAYFAVAGIENEPLFNCCDGDYCQTLTNVIYCKNMKKSRGSRFDLCYGEKGVCFSILIKYYQIEWCDSQKRDCQKGNYRQNDLFVNFPSFKSFEYAIDFSIQNISTIKLKAAKRRGIKEDINQPFKFATFNEDYFKNKER